MLIDQIPGLAAETPEAAAPAGTLGRDEFLKMLIAQLENQDPLNPQDSTEFSAQLAQFSSLEQLLRIDEGLGEVVSSQQEVARTIRSLAGASLIGREAFAASDQFEIGADGSALSLPGFELEGTASTVDLRVFDSRDRGLGTISLGAQNAGTIWIDASALSHLPSGTYRFEVQAEAGESNVAATALVRGRVQSARPTASEVLLSIGSITVPYAEVREIRSSGDAP